MLYSLLQLPARWILHLYIKKLWVNKPEAFRLKGPLLLAVNHPNSFLDAIILCSLFHEPIWSLARGDVFQKHKWVTKILKSLKIYPVYRTREGAEYLDLNYATFEACRELFKKDSLVLIFSEGLCENEWHLRPLKKGTARLAISTWEEGTELRVLTIGLNYSSFKKYGKNLRINIGNIFDKSIVEDCETEGQRMQKFNRHLNEELKQLVEEIDENDLNKIQSSFSFELPIWKKIIYFIPGIIGTLLHAPILFLMHTFVQKKFAKSGHYDSLLIVGLFVLYPIFILAITLILFFITGNHWSWLLLLIIPILGRCALLIKKIV